MSNKGEEDNKAKSKRKYPSKSKKVCLQKNIQLCLNFGFGTLITAKNDMDYRNAIISIHNGTELLMKYYLQSKDKRLIFRKINRQVLLHGRDDLIKKLDSNNLKPDTISYNECMSFLEFFSELPNKNKRYLSQLGWLRNNCVHHEYSYDIKETRKLLISYIYRYINDLVSELELQLQDFISKKYIEPLNKFKQTIDNEIEQNYLEKVAAAKKHYFDELNEEEQKQKKSTVDYTKDKKRIDEIVQCPACKNDALLRKKIQVIREPFETYAVIKRTLVLKDLSCYHCGLNITGYDQLKLQFSDKEKSLRSSISYYDCPVDCPDDCPPDDCPDDCPPDDCPDDCPEH